MAEQLKSIDGPNDLSIRGPIPNVARLSSKAKVMIVGAAAVVAGGIVIGTMTAGQSKLQQAEATVGTSTDGVGSVAPPEAPMPMPVAKQEPLTPRDDNNEEASLSPANNMQANGAPTPAQQHREWVEKHRYTRLQGLILAGEAALTSDTSKSTGGVTFGAGLNRVAMNDEAEGDPLVTAQNQYLATRQRLEEAQMRANPRSIYSNNANASELEYPDEGDGNAATGQGQNKGFLAKMKAASGDGYLPELKQNSLAENSLFAGSIIPAVLTTAINSDLPGTISGHVRQTIYDSRNHRVVLIPQGTKIVGEYSSDVGFGQKRVLVAWNHLIFPDGSTINIKGMSGADGQGRSGFEDQVNNHYLRTFGSAALISVLSVGAQLSQPQNSGSLNTAPGGAQAAGALANSMNQTGTKLLNKNLGVQPTLEIRAGYSFNILVNKTMALPPYQQLN